MSVAAKVTLAEYIDARITADDDISISINVDYAYGHTSIECEIRSGGSSMRLTKDQALKAIKILEGAK